MADITLNQVNMTLLKQNSAQEEMQKDIAGLRRDFSDYFKFLKRSALDDLEAKREAKDSRTSAPSKAQVVKKDDGMGFGILTALIGGAVIAITAAVEALRDYFGKLKAMAIALSKGLKPLAKAVGGIARLIKNVVKGLAIALDNKLFGGAIGKALKRIADSIDDFFKPIRNFFRSGPSRFGARFAAISETIGTFFDDLLKPMRNFFTNFRAGFNRIGTAGLGAVDDVIKMGDFSTLTAKIGASLKLAISKPFDMLFGSFKTVEAGEDLAKVGDTLSDFFKPIKNFFSVSEDSFIGKMWGKIKGAFKIFSEGSVFMKTMAAVGRTIGKLAWPLTVIFGIIDSVTGYFAEYVDDDGKVKKGGILGGLSGLLEGIIGMPLDLIKSAVAWIAKKFGAKDTAKFLESFSITDMVRNIIMTPVAAIQSALNSIIEGIANFIEGSTLLSKVIDPETVRGLKMEQSGSLQTTKDARALPKKTGEDIADQVKTNAPDQISGGTQVVGKIGDDVTLGSSSTTMTPDALAATDPNTFGFGTSP